MILLNLPEKLADGSYVSQFLLTSESRWESYSLCLVEVLGFVVDTSHELGPTNRSDEHMYSIVAIALQLIYAVGVLGLAFYGLHALWLTVSVRRMLRAKPRGMPRARSSWR